MVIKEENKAQEKKGKAVEELKELIEKSKTVMLTSIKNLPARQFQLIKKKIADKGIIKIMKKNIIIRAIDSIDKGAIKHLKAEVKEDLAFIFSDLDTFELSAMLSENKSPVKAKVGQIAPCDIIIDEGPTELVPGPVISELGALGLKIAVEDGKITIKEKKAIVKQGEKIREEAASLMSKLDIRPFYVGLEPILAYDAREGKIYRNIVVNKEQTLDETKKMYGKSLAFAIKIGYVCSATIGMLLAKANSQFMALEKLMKQEEKPAEEKTEEKVEENKI